MTVDKAFDFTQYDSATGPTDALVNEKPLFKYNYSDTFNLHNENYADLKFDILQKILDDFDGVELVFCSGKSDLVRCNLSYKEFKINILITNYVYCDIYSKKENIKECVDVFEKIKLITNDFIQQKKDKEESIRVWHEAQGRASYGDKRIECTEWEEIKDNYPSINDEIDYLFSLENPHELGKLIFWYGPPGTGKTHAIRALIKKLQSNYTIEVIGEPERFVSSISNMNSVILSGDNDDASSRIEEMFSSRGVRGRNKRKRKIKGKIIILEDTPDLVLQEGRASNAHMMGRLLNMTDGLIGQGTKIIFLLTTNEKIDKIDPAFTRAGRALQVLEFPALTEEESKEWLDKKTGDKELSKDIDKDTTLADLYAKYNKNNQPTLKEKKTQKIGF